MISPSTVSDFFITKGAVAGGVQPSQLGLMKLLYFAQGWAMALLDAPLFYEDIFAWRLGPVVKSERQRLKMFKDQPIPLDFADQRAAGLIEGGARDIVEQIWVSYAVENPGTLVGLTHLRGTPWNLVRDQNEIEWEGNSDILIPKDMIKDYFVDLHKTSLWGMKKNAIALLNAMSIDEIQEQSRSNVARIMKRRSSDSGVWVS